MNCYSKWHIKIITIEYKYIGLNCKYATNICRPVQSKAFRAVYTKITAVSEESISDNILHLFVHPCCKIAGTLLETFSQYGSQPSVSAYKKFTAESPTIDPESSQHQSVHSSFKI